MPKLIISLAILLVIGAGTAVFFFAGNSLAVSAPVTTATTEASVSTVWGTLPSDTTTSTTAKAPSKSVKAPSSSQSTTSTSEVGLPLTKDQEATIQAGMDASDEANADAREHMSDSTDYDLPYSTTTTVMDIGSQDQ